jgi:hypothetical protein
MNPSLGKVLAQIAATIGFALLAGLGGELAKTAGEQMRTKLKKDDDKPDEVEELKKRQAELEAELKRLRAEVDAARARPITEA